jgi:hypothetical protein
MTWESSSDSKESRYHEPESSGAFTADIFLTMPNKWFLPCHARESGHPDGRHCGLTFLCQRYTVVKFVLISNIPFKEASDEYR